LGKSVGRDDAANDRAREKGDCAIKKGGEKGAHSGNRKLMGRVTEHAQSTPLPRKKEEQKWGNREPRNQNQAKKRGKKKKRDAWKNKEKEKKSHVFVPDGKRKQRLPKGGNTSKKRELWGIQSKGRCQKKERGDELGKIGTKN